MLITELPLTLLGDVEGQEPLPPQLPLLPQPWLENEPEQQLLLLYWLVGVPAQVLPLPPSLSQDCTPI
ncbi:MAG TPA: hypothetical protein VMB73_30340, partial [Acetobacteraceae bacterium]|nr:hypothetical protein [Acetobacteraceae bacterium]